MYRHAFLVAALAVPAAAQQNCADLSRLVLPGVTILQAASVSAGSFTPPGGRAASVPGFCRVAGRVRPEVNFEVWMPEQWNGKFLMVGNGGLAGTISYNAMFDPLRRGYATASTDTGHTADNDGHWAQGHMQRVIDFAHRAVHVTTVASKAVLRARYGRMPSHSYFSGCSQGGQEALTEAQRYPDDYDGIIAGDPANSWTRLYTGGHLWIAHALLLNPASYIPSSKVAMLGDAVNQACDALDGVTDGVLNDPRRCHFDPATLLCKNGDAPDCFTAAQVEAVGKIYQGPRTDEGEQLFPGIMPGGEAGPGGWSRWITGTAPGNGAHMTLGFPFLRYVAFEDPNWDFRTFRFNRQEGFDSDVDFVDRKLGPIFDNMNPDLRAFQARGGKLIQYHGWSDPDIAPMNSVNYYESVAALMDRSAGEGLRRTRDFYRLYMVPGMQHCSGGPGTDNFDMLTALEKWVEQDVAPEAVIATHQTNGAVDRSRPLCPYPQEAQWTGSGDTNRAENFVCALPKAP
jgi:feruloyl esterase